MAEKEVVPQVHPPLYRFLLALVTPRILPKDLGEVQRARLILACLFFLVLISGANVVLWSVLLSLDAFSVAAFFIFLALYLVGRMGSYERSIRALVVVFLAMPYFYLLSDPTKLDIFALLFLGFLSMIIASMFTTFRSTLIVAIFNFAMIFSINQLISDDSPLESLAMLLPVMLLTVLLLFNAYQKEKTRSPKLNNLYDFHPEAVLIQLDNFIVYANAAAARLLNVALPENLLGQLVAEHLPLTSSHYHVENNDGRFILRYEDALAQQDKRIEIKATSIPYGADLATLLLIKPLAETSAESEEKSFRTLSRLMSDYAYALEVRPDQSLKFIWVAGAIEMITGKADDDVLALAGWESLVHPEDLAFYRLRQKVLLNGEARSLEYRILRPDGTSSWVQDNATPLRDPKDQRVYRILGEAHDISERIHAQEVLRAHVVQQAVVAELGLLALSIDDPQHLLSHAVVLCEQVLEAQLCVIFEDDAEKHELFCRSSSRPESVLPVGKRLSSAPQSSLTAYTLFSQEAIVSVDLSKEERFTVLPEIIQQQFHSAMSVVILGQNTPFGVLSVYSQKQQVFDNDEVYFLQSVANVLGTFIERSRAQAAEREQREFAEALRDATAMINSRLELNDVLNKILTYLPQVVPAMESASVMLYDETEKLYHIVNTWGYSAEVIALIEAQVYSRERFPILEKGIETKRPLIISNILDEPLWFRSNDAENVQSYLGAPIIVQGNYIGFLHLNSSKLNAFSPKDAERVQSFADKTGTAIINARRADELERLVKIRTEELNKQREQLAAILNSTGEGIFYVEDGQIVFANQRLCEMTGYPLEQLVGKDSNLLLPDDLSKEERDSLRKMEADVQAGQVARLETRFVRQDKQSFAVGITSSALQAKDKVLRKVSIIRDISQEQELAQLKNRFIANAAHDLRSPITSLKMRMYMIEKHPAQLSDHLEKLETVINRMNRLVGDLLDSATIGQGTAAIRPESIILQDVLQSVVEILQPEAEQAKLDLALEMPELPLHIWADTVRLEQVFTNLITNAMHYTPSAGSIRVLCKRAEAMVIIEVIDTGTGIPAESQELIFQPFYRLRQNPTIKGTGLGLSITRDIVLRHGGQITVSSEVGKGTCFRISLPLLEEN